MGRSAQYFGTKSSKPTWGKGDNTGHQQGDDQIKEVKCPRCECKHFVVTSATRVYCNPCRQALKAGGLYDSPMSQKIEYVGDYIDSYQ